MFLTLHLPSSHNIYKHHVHIIISCAIQNNLQTINFMNNLLQAFTFCKSVEIKIQLLVQL